MLVVDSSVWVEIIANTKTGRDLVKRIPADESNVAIPAIVILEVTKWLLRECDHDACNRFLAYADSCHPIPLTQGLAVESAEICRKHRLATADAIVYASARAVDADLLTCDAHFEGLSRVIYIPNRP